MPLYICDICGCIENTALGHYWSRDRKMFSDESLLGKKLCSECAPSEFFDGSKTQWGKWHDRFPKEHWSEKYETMPEGGYIQ